MTIMQENNISYDEAKMVMHNENFTFAGERSSGIAAEPRGYTYWDYETVKTQNSYKVVAGTRVKCGVGSGHSSFVKIMDKWARPYNSGGHTFKADYISPVICLIALVMIASTSIVALAESTDSLNSDTDKVIQDSEPVTFVDDVANSSELPTFIDGDKVSLNEITTRDGGGMRYISSEYVRNKQIGVIFNWTSASTVTKSLGFNIGTTITAKVFGINMSIRLSWNPSTTYTWTKPEKYSQFRGFLPLEKSIITVHKFITMDKCRFYGRKVQERIRYTTIVTYILTA